MRNKFLILTVLLITLSVASLACSEPEEKVEIPRLSTVAKYTDTELNELSHKVNKEDLIDAWGNPRENVDHLLWEYSMNGQKKFLIARLESSKVIGLELSQTMYAVVASDDLLLLTEENFSIKNGTLTAKHSEDYFGNEITLSLGDKLYLETDGRIMESYPLQISPPYAVEIVNKALEEELLDLDKIVKDYYDENQE